MSKETLIWNNLGTRGNRTLMYHRSLNFMIYMFATVSFRKKNEMGVIKYWISLISLVSCHNEIKFLSFEIFLNVLNSSLLPFCLILLVIVHTHKKNACRHIKFHQHLDHFQSVNIHRRAGCLTFSWVISFSEVWKH